jgi:hypothetical protein
MIMRMTKIMVVMVTGSLRANTSTSMRTDTLTLTHMRYRPTE